MRITYYTNPNYHEGMTYYELRKLRGYSIERIVDYNIDGKNVRVSVRHRDLSFIGNRCFIRPQEIAWFSFKNNRFFGDDPHKVFSNLPKETRSIVLDEINLSWMKDLPDPLWPYAAKRNIFRSILLHNIYSQETLVKAIGRRFYKMKSTDFSWRVLRDFIVTRQDFSIWDLMCFTKNYNESMKRLVAIPDDFQNREATELRQRLSDMLRMAADENRIINFRWSNARLELEHKKQVERTTALEMTEKSDEKLYSDELIAALEQPNIRLLKTEREIFFEGAIMHHCVYNVYYRRIRKKNYMAFHLSSPEDCTMGLCLRNGNLVLDQIYLKYDKKVSEETYLYAADYVSQHEELITAELKTSQSEEEEDDDYALPF